MWQPNGTPSLLALISKWPTAPRWRRCAATTTLGPSRVTETETSGRTERHSSRSCRMPRAPMIHQERDTEPNVRKNASSRSCAPRMWRCSVAMDPEEDARHAPHSYKHRCKQYNRANRIGQKPHDKRAVARRPRRPCPSKVCGEKEEREQEVPREAGRTVVTD